MYVDSVKKNKNLFSAFFIKCKAANVIDYTSICEPEGLVIFNSLFITRRKNLNLRKSLVKRMNTYLTKKKKKKQQRQHKKQ